MAGFLVREHGPHVPPPVRIIPKKTDDLLQRMNKNSHSYIEAEEAELLTLNWHCVGEKPA